jgi:hypothetical protein
VYKCTLFLIGAVKPERIDLYSECIRTFVTTYGEVCWRLIYQADVRTRSEHIERVRRNVQIQSAIVPAPL